MNYYLVVIKKLSNDGIERTITQYDNKDTAVRKYHEAFNVIGGGPKRITSMLIEDSVSAGYGQLINEQGEREFVKSLTPTVIMQETWISDEELKSL